MSHRLLNLQIKFARFSFKITHYVHTLAYLQRPLILTAIELTINNVWRFFGCSQRTIPTYNNIGSYIIMYVSTPRTFYSQIFIYVLKLMVGNKLTL